MLKPEKFSESHPYISSIFIIISLLFVLFVSGMISVLGNIDNKITFFFGFLIFSIVLILIINKNKRWKYYGFFLISQLKKKEKIIFIPLFILGFMPLLAGIRSNLSFQAIIYLLIYMAIVAFVEETIFRGIILKILIKKSYIKAIIGSSFLFSLAHILNTLQSNNLKMIIIQISYAFIIGMILSILVIRTNNIILPIIFHYINNIMTSLNPSGVNNISNVVTYTMFFIAILYLSYLLYTMKKSLIRLQADVI
ncbi:MAG: CPBP family intramembrane metalloprotease [Halanaerobiales bacterium]|nr:CPBP family intramembrane metalloprotease [Halanaerobiales bacterium]